MLAALVLTGCLAVAQVSGGPGEEQPAPSPPPSAPDRGLFMNCLQGTYPGFLLDGNRLNVSGWSDVSFTASTDHQQQLPMGFNYRANEFLLQQNWVRVERRIDTTSTTPTWGFRSDNILPGSDYRFTVARGLLSDQLTADHGQPNLYGIDPVQFYAELYVPNVCRGLDVKVGRFFAQVGAESTDTTLNFFASRSYTFIYSPFTHTGVLTTLQLNDVWSVQNGLVLGSDVFIASESRPTYIGSVKWAPPNGRSTVLFSVILGPGRFERRENFNNPEVLDLVVTHQVNARLNYLTWQCNERWSAGGRLEFFDDVNGQRTGFRGLYVDVTVGINWKPCAALWVRPELRYDNNCDSQPFEGKANLFTAAMDVVLRW
jgi:hypothetical protein